MERDALFQRPNCRRFCDDNMFAVKMQQIRREPLRAPFRGNFIDTRRDFRCFFARVFRIYWPDCFDSVGEFGTDICCVALAFIEIEPCRVVIFVEIYRHCKLGLPDGFFDKGYLGDIRCFKSAVNINPFSVLTRPVDVTVGVNTRDEDKRKAFQEFKVVALQELQRRRNARGLIAVHATGDEDRARCCR